MRSRLEKFKIYFEYLEGDDWDRQQRFEKNRKARVYLVNTISKLPFINLYKWYLNKLVARKKRNEAN